MQYSEWKDEHQCCVWFVENKWVSWVWNPEREVIFQQDFDLSYSIDQVIAESFAKTRCEPFQ